MYSLATFSLSDMTECSAALRRLGAGAMSMEEVARRLVQYLYTHLVVEQTGVNACALVRFFKTHPYGELNADSRRSAREALGREPQQPTMKCLTLLGTVGEKPEWNARENSRRYRAVPCASKQFVEQFPMISHLLKQFGVNPDLILEPDAELLLDWEEKTYNVFHVPEAVGSPLIPVQEEFVIPFGIQSVLGFGGILPSKNLFAVILFSKVPIRRETADLFKPLALSAKLAILPFDGTAVFARR